LCLRITNGLVGAAIVIGGAVAGVRLLGPDVPLTARSAWRPLSSGLRRTPGGDALSAGPKATFRLPGLSRRDTVRLTVSAAAGAGVRRLAVTRGDRPAVRAHVSESESVVEIGPGPGSELTLSVDGDASPEGALYQIHEILVQRRGPLSRLTMIAPALLGLAIYLSLLRGENVGRSILWAGVTMAATAALLVSLDPLLTARVTRSGLDRGWAVVAAGALLAALGESGVRRRLASARERITTGGRVGPGLVVALGLVLALALVAHVPGLNGPSYWQWSWRSLEAGSVFPAVGLASLPFFVARDLRRRALVGNALALALVSAGVALTATAALAVQPYGLDRVHAIVESPGITAYYTDAETLADTPHWLGTLPDRMWRLHVHSRTKPPGPLLFYVALLRWLGPGVGAAAGALLLLAAAAAAVPAVYLLARELGGSPDAAFEAACLTAWSPSLLLFFPEMDQAFPLVTCAALLAWHRALRGRLIWAVVFGLVATAASLFSYSFLVLGVAGLLLAAREPHRSARAAAVATAVIVGAYAVLHAATGFDPLATFRTALANQARLSITWGRRYAPAVLHDPLDFAMGAGWVSAALAAGAVVQSVRARAWRSLPLLSAAQVAIVDLTGLLRVEAARVWLLLLPFVTLPAGAVLVGWTEGERNTAYAVMVLLLAALAQNMTFIDLGASP